MSTIRIPDGYTSDKPLTLLETQKAIDIIKLVFIRHLKSALCLTRVSAPLFVADHTGLNDDLNNVERAVCFDIKETAAPLRWSSLWPSGSGTPWANTVLLPAPAW